MPCRSCASESQKTFGSEISIHFPGRKGLDRTAVLVFPKLVVCTNCGFTEFTIPDAELHRLREPDAIQRPHIHGQSSLGQNR
jgi:hypothetical protein